MVREIVEKNGRNFFHTSNRKSIPGPSCRTSALASIVTTNFCAEGTRFEVLPRFIHFLIVMYGDRYLGRVRIFQCLLLRIF